MPDRIHQLEIIVSRCTKPTDERGVTSFGFSFRTSVPVYNNGQRAFEEQYAQNRMKPWCREGFCVIIRPDYNAHDGSLYEYRSFNGEEFKKVEFRFNGSISVKISD